MSGKKSAATGVGVGGSSILVIFILLCLTTFATLSTVSANADLRLAEKTAQATREYYDADAKAEMFLADIMQALPPGGDPAADAQAYTAAVTSAMVDAVVEPGAGGGLTVRYTVPVNSMQELYVELELLSAGSPGEPRYRKTAWQIVSIGEWEPESEGFDLWTGEDEMMVLYDGLPPGLG